MSAPSRASKPADSDSMVSATGSADGFAHDGFVPLLHRLGDGALPTTRGAIPDRVDGLPAYRLLVTRQLEAELNAVVRQAEPPPGHRPETVTFQLRYVRPAKRFLHSYAPASPLARSA